MASNQSMAAKALTLTLVLLTIAPLAAAAPLFTVLDLGGFGGEFVYTRGTAINDLGQVAGYGYTSNIGIASYRAFRTAPNASINPATDDLSAGGGFNCTGLAINNLGQVAGDMGPASGAFRTAPNAPINLATDDLGTLGGRSTFVHGLNDLGQVVGLSYGSDLRLYPFRTAPNAPINPTTDQLFSGIRFATAYAINNAGQVTGGFPPENEADRAYRTAPNAPINPATDDLGELHPRAGGVGWAINNLGQVAGMAYTSNNAHAFLTAPNAPINPATDDLCAGGAAGINDLGQVVGYATGRGPFLYTDGELFILKDLLAEPLPTGWYLSNAADINNHGQIIANGYDAAGHEHAFLLTPIPEPACLWLLPASALALTRRRT